MPTTLTKEQMAKGGKNKKGKKHKTTLDREAALEAWHQGVINRTQGLLTVQSVLAFGCIKVMRIDSHWEGSAKNKKLVKSKPVIVEDDDEIIAAIDYEYGDGDCPNTDSAYYFVATKDPDNQAINSLMDRTFGRAQEKIDLTSKGKKVAAQIIGMRIIKDND